jgi:4-alpha-glucanotransferase
MRFPRAGGVLLHPTSLPGPHGSGDLGPAAFHFVDWLAAGGQGLWQVLPLGGIGPGHSPYMSMSAFAGNELLVDLAELRDRGWLEANDLAPPPGLSDRSVAFDVVVPYRLERLAKAARRFEQSANAGERTDLEAFTARHARWLRDYALFRALTEHSGEVDGRDWCDWDLPLAQRDAAALRNAEARHAERIAFWTFCQWCFHRQWQHLRTYANGRGVRIVGDVPIFLAHHSADVWAHRDLFELDATGHPHVVAGVPPDLFSATGQRWGNPLYRWQAHARDGYAWWIERIRHTLALVDAVRVDHFRGFVAHWEIARGDPTAINGRWVEGPGEALFHAIESALGPLPLVAEDLGVITPDVDRLRRQFGFPGMRVLQFAWAQGDGSANRYLPHNHEPDTVAFTGTHDNDTAVGWWANASEAERHHLREYLATDGHDIAWDLIRAVHASVADTAIVPLQDVLRLGSEHRMNVPAAGEGQWRWRFSWADVRPEHAEQLLRISRLYGRAADRG